MIERMLYFNLHTLGNCLYCLLLIFQVAFHKLCCWNFGSFLLTELLYQSQVCWTPASHTLLQFIEHIFIMDL